MTRKTDGLLSLMASVCVLSSIYTNHQQLSLSISVRTRIPYGGGSGAAIPGGRESGQNIDVIAMKKYFALKNFQLLK
jgi:hypothetical protein